jgi:ferric-dicitrate binding protein FerR (iron transport regulator)
MGEPPSVRPGRGVRVGAGVLLAAALAGLVGLSVHQRRASAHGDVAANARREVRVDGRAVAVLEPGAHVAWGGGEVTQSGGEVFWRVEHAARFGVGTPAGEITGSGTCFRATLLGGPPVGSGPALVVHVYEGKAVLSRGAASIELGAGDAARADASGVHAVPARERAGEGDP